jgi:hypothetical protein
MRGRRPLAATGASVRVRAPLLHQVPINSDNASVCEPLQRLRKREIACAFLFLKSHETKISSTVGLLDCHDAIVFDQTLQVPVGGRFLPQRINCRLTRVGYHIRKACGLYFKKLHWWRRQSGKVESFQPT